MTSHEIPARPSRSGFTLIELLVVIAIIALLVSLLMPSLKQAKDLARAALCQSNSRLIGLSIPQYLNDNEDFLPRYADAIYPSDYAAEDVDPSEYDGTDGALRKVLRYALITTWQGEIYDPVRNGDGFFAPYLNNTNNNKINLLGCPSVPDRRGRQVLTHNWREYNYHIERGKSYCLNFSQVTRIEQQGGSDISLPLAVNKVPRPAELVYMAEGPARAVHFHLIGEGGWDGWTADIPTPRHFGEFNMAFCDGHSDRRPMVGTFPDPYFRRE